MRDIWIGFVIPSQKPNEDVKLILTIPPVFPYNVDQYTPDPKKKQTWHVTFRCPKVHESEAIAYLRDRMLKWSSKYDWDEHVGTIENARIGTKLAEVAIREYGNKPNVLQLTEMLHFFCDALGLGIDNEARLYTAALAYWRGLSLISRVDSTEE